MISFYRHKPILSLYLSPSVLAAEWSGPGAHEKPAPFQWERQVLQPELLEATLDELLAEIRRHLDRKKLNAILVLSSEWCVWRNFDLPFSSSQKIRAVIPSEMANLAPHCQELGDMACIRIGNTAANNAVTSVLACGLPQERLLKWQSCLDKHQIDTQAICLAALNNVHLAIRQAGSGADGWLLHVTHDHLTLMAIHKGCIQFARSTYLRMDDTLSVQLKGVLRHSQLALGAFDMDAFQPSCLWLVGETDADGTPPITQNTAAQVARALGLDFRALPIDAFVSDRTQPAPPQSSQKSLAFHDMALARQLFRHNQLISDFMPVMEAARPFTLRYASALRWTAQLTICLLVLTIGRLWLSNQRLQTYLNALVPQSDSVHRVAMDSGKVVPTPTALALLSEQMAVPRDLAEIPLVLDMLMAMTRQTSNDGSIQLRHFNYRYPQLSMEGRARDFKSLEAFQQALAQEPFFTAVEILSARSANQKQEVAFSISMQVHRQNRISMDAPANSSRSEKP